MLGRTAATIRYVLAVGVILAGVATVVWAQPAAQDGFVAVVPGSDPNQEVLPATPLVFAAYAFVWLAMIVYVFTLWRRVVRVERELADVTAKLEARRR